MRAGVEEGALAVARGDRAQAKLVLAGRERVLGLDLEADPLAGFVGTLVHLLHHEHDRTLFITDVHPQADRLARGEHAQDHLELERLPARERPVAVETEHARGLDR